MSHKDHQDKASPQTHSGGVQSNQLFLFKRTLFVWGPIWHMGNWGSSSSHYPLKGIKEEDGLGGNFRQPHPHEQETDSLSQQICKEGKVKYTKSLLELWQMSLVFAN